MAETKIQDRIPREISVFVGGLDSIRSVTGRDRREMVMTRDRRGDVVRFVEASLMCENDDHCGWGCGVCEEESEMIEEESCRRRRSLC